jgi:pilus assembly protein CpaE
VVTTGDGNLASLPALVAGSDPDLLVLALPKATVDDLDVLDRLAHLYPRMTPVLVSDQQTPDFLVRAMRAGVREVLPSASTIDDLVDSVGRIGVRRAAQPDKHGNVIAFISCKGGGGGATFLATNTAYALAASEGKRVILIDLNLQWGDAVFFLADKRPSITLADLALQMHRVDPAYLAASLVKVHPNLGVLGAPEDPVHALDIRPEHVELLLRIARMAYDYVVLDTGRALDAVTVRALDHADVIFPVMQISLPFIRDGKRLLSAFRALDYPPQKVRIVVNRYQKGGEISLKDLEDSLGIKAYRTIPNDYDRVSKSVNQGVPVDKLAHGSLVARSLREFAHELVAAPATAPPTWFDRIIRKT